MRRVLGCVFIFAASLISSSDKPAFTRQDKAFFLAPDVVNFVRPGLAVKIPGASIASDGTIQVQYTVTDPQGLALDITGVNTPGVVTPTFVAAYIPKGGTDYITVFTRTATGKVSGTVNQPGADTAGGKSVQNADGSYTYTFGGKLPANFDRTQTVTIGMYASRNLSDFGLGTNSANSESSFVPAGGAVADIHDVIHTQTCNKCHDPLAAHGGARRDVQLCVLCHNPGGPNVQTVDPDTGNSIDFKVLIHKIHMGSQLPSVQAGHPYQLIGFQNAVNDFSDVVFPADIRNCQMCHEVGAPPPGGTAPPGSMTTFSATNPAPVQGDWWLTHPTRAACGSCHDNVNFATGENHAGLPQLNDNQCTQCHFPQGELPFDISIIGAHTIPQFAPGLPGVVFTLKSVTNGAAGQKPTVTFTINDKSGTPIAPSSMDFLQLTLAGPTSDYASALSENAKSATGSGGTYTYTFNAAVPANATGSYTVGIEGYKNVTLLPGTTTATTVRDAGLNQVLSFSVSGGNVAAHPVEATTANCNQCHYQLMAHGGIRNEVQYCILCHNPNATDASLRPANAGPPQAIDFPVMIHRIHMGENAPAGGQLTPYIIYGFGGSKNDFSDVAYPGDLRDCAKCHVNNSEDLPLPATRIPVQNPQAFFSPMGPATAACTACHTAQSTAAHAQLNTSPTLGESCDVCHGNNAQFSVASEHARTL